MLDSSRSHLRIIVAGMIFNISVGFANVPSPDNKSKYSIWLADTVHVRPVGEAPVVLTSELDRKFKGINYELSDEPVPPPKKGPKAPQRSDAKKPASKPAPDPDKPSPVSSDRKKIPPESVVLRDRLRSRNKSSTLEEIEKLLERQKVRELSDFIIVVNSGFEEA